MSGYVRNFKTGVAIAAYTAAKFGSTDFSVVPGAAETDMLIGVTGIMPGEVGRGVDIIIAGPAEIKLAGSITRGAQITCNADGLGVALSAAMLLAGHAYSLGWAMESGSAGDVISFMLCQQKVSRVDSIAATVAELDALAGAPMGATFVIGAEAANVINVAIQLKDADGDDLAVRGCVYAYLSTDANGDSLAAAPSGGVAIGTDGLAAEVIDNRAFFLTSEADGDIDLNITVSSGAATYYLAVRLANGKLVVSNAITFAA